MVLGAMPLQRLIDEALSKGCELQTDDELLWDQEYGNHVPPAILGEGRQKRPTSTNQRPQHYCWTRNNSIRKISSWVVIELTTEYCLDKFNYFWV